MASQLPAHKAPRSLDDILEAVNHREETLDVVFVANRNVSCVGSGPALGHPKVFYTIGEPGYVECMYCDRVFVLDPERAGQS
ncbi:MAG: zinc-finger domain-containing protein [Parvularculaceae bacterium]|nr:zinc-finger domain-containing protein [Parvularculaceae bacterium]